MQAGIGRKVGYCDYRQTRSPAPLRHGRDNYHDRDERWRQRTAASIVVLPFANLSNVLAQGTRRHFRRRLATFARAGLSRRRTSLYPPRQIRLREGTVELNELEELERQGLKPRSRWSRRGFVMTSLATGFALSVQPVSAQ